MGKPFLSADRVINSPAVSVFVAGMTSFIFFINRNLFTYSYPQVFISLVVQIFLSLASAFIIILAGMAINRIATCLQDRLSTELSTKLSQILTWHSHDQEESFKQKNAKHAIEDFLTRLLQQTHYGLTRLLLRLTRLHWTDALALVGVLAWMQLTPQIYHLQILVLKSCPWLLFAVRIKTLLAVIGVLVLWHGVRPFNLVLVPLFFITLSTFPVVLGKEIMEPAPPTALLEPKVTFKTKPNVYLFFLESFTSKENMHHFFNIDSDPFYQELASLGYVVKDTYSSRTYTMGSAATLMLMHHFPAKEWFAGRWDVKKSMHKMMSGITYNPVLQEFKQNGYQIAYLHRERYLYRFKSPVVDISNLDTGSPRRYLDPIVNAHLSGIESFREKELPLLPTIKTIVRRQLHNNKPTFYFMYSGLYHGVKDDDFNRELYLRRYRQVYHDFTPKFIDLLKFINQEDPEAIVMMTGDHGAGAQRPYIFRGNTHIDLGYSPDEIAQDCASVFFAIKNPVDNNAWREVTKRPITHVNLFRYLFAILADDRSLMDKAAPDISLYVDDSIIARNNHPLKEWDPPKK